MRPPDFLIYLGASLKCSHGGVFAISIYVPLHVEGSGHSPRLAGGQIMVAPLVRPRKRPVSLGMNVEKIHLSLLRFYFGRTTPNDDAVWPGA